MPAGLVDPPGRQGPGPLPSGAVEALDLRLVRRAAGQLPGEHRGVGVGVGTELAQLRPYEIGDDVRQLDPSASARTGVPHVRQHVPERALTTWVVLDLSPSMAFGTAARLKSDVAEGVALVVSRLAIRRGGRLGVLTCGAPVTRVLPPRGGRRALAQAVRAISEGVSPDGHHDPGAVGHALAHIADTARQPGLVVVVSDFRDDPGAWRRPLRAIAARHRVLCVEIGDPRERELPDAGVVVVVDPETGREVEADTKAASLRHAYARAEARRRGAVRDAMRRCGALRVELSTAGDWLLELGRALA